MDEETSTFDSLPYAEACSSKVLVVPEGTFQAMREAPFVSSDRKHAYRGQFEMADGPSVQAIAVFFSPNEPVSFARELASLDRNHLLGVGPKLLCTCEGRERFRYQGEAGSATAEAAAMKDVMVSCPVIIEEDVGISLSRALFSGAPVPGTLDHPEWEAPLAEVGSDARSVENDKIRLDLLVQLFSLHESGYYHRDVRDSNVCVRRHGPNPQDIRAVLIDHELETDYAGTEIPAVAKGLQHVLFERIPHEICDRARTEPPTSLVRDLGYLAALELELAGGKPFERACAADFRTGDSDDRPLFTYSDDGQPVVHRISLQDDIVPLGRKLGLASVDADNFLDPRLLERVRSSIKHGGFVDARDLAEIESWHFEMGETPVDRIALEVLYPMWLAECERNGRTPEYESFDAQPELLKESTRNQVRDIFTKVAALGYRVLPKEQVKEGNRVESFSSEEIEYLAFLEHRRWVQERADNGWIYGVPRNDERRIHPYLVAYDDLPDDIREYDRAFARTIIEILDSAGLAVTR